VKTPFFSVYIPLYNNSATIAATLRSVFNQTFTDFEVIVRDDGSKDNTLKVVNKFHDSRLTIKKNKVNLGYSGNLNCGLTDCHSDNIFILAGDDLIDINTLQWYYDAFKQYPQAGAITRPYYWFDNDYHIPVRLKPTTNSTNNLLVTTKSSFDKITLVLSSLDQCSGLCFKRNLTDMKFSPEVWISHAYPWLDIFKNHPVIFLKNYPLAVYIGHSTTRTNIYQKSPMLYWKTMIDTIFFESKYTTLKQRIISDFIGTNFVGLMQIRNYGSFKSYLREVKLLISFNPRNLLNIKFWLYTFITFITPPVILRLVVDKYKSLINQKHIDRSIVINLR
jgi:glycosyltransferase involved in cell wall biosynthesis